jgi:predicted enzyme related to lactoylglutathione lyase
MFATTEAYSGFAVKDLAQAKEFYGGTLGMTIDPVPGMEQMPLMALHIQGSRDVLVYEKPDHTPATYTILNFPVEDVDKAVDELTAKGVTFERYDGFDQDDRGIAQQGPRIAWFTDPSGNILAVMNRP